MRLFDRFKNHKTQFFIDGYLYEDAFRDKYFCELSRIDESAAKTCICYIKLTFGNTNKLIKKEKYFTGKLKNIPLSNEEKEFEYVDYQINIPGELKLDKNGLHQFGGQKPVELELPTLDGSLVAYIGKISKEEKLFEWLDFDLHLVCPTFLDFADSISIDYSNPLKPVFINKEEVEGNSFCDVEAMKDLNQSAIYSKVNFSFVENNDFGDLPEKSIKEILANPSNSRGSFGVPAWNHEPFLPYCPKTQGKMKFIFRINGVSEAKLMSKIPKSIDQGESDRLDFGSGNLHVFFQPESKVLTYFAQYT